MVKGISRQVIVVHAPEPKLFEQAIFILNNDAVGQEGITDELLLKEANRLIHTSAPHNKRNLFVYGPVWAAVGAALTGAAWILSILF